MNKTPIQWTEYDRGWLEAAIDGEGSLTFKTQLNGKRTLQTFRPSITIGNTDRGFIEHAARLLGNPPIYIAERQSLNRRTLYHITVYSNALRWILPRLRLIIKDEQRRMLLEALTLLEKRGRNRFAVQARRIDCTCGHREGLHRRVSHNKNGLRWSTYGYCSVCSCREFSAVRTKVEAKDSDWHRLKEITIEVARLNHNGSLRAKLIGDS